MFKSTLLAGLALASFLAFPAPAQDGSCTRGKDSQCTRGGARQASLQGPHARAGNHGSAPAAEGSITQSPAKKAVRSVSAEKKAAAAAPACICGKPLAEGSNYPALVHHGKALVFCNEKCLAAFCKKKGKCPAVAAREAAAKKKALKGAGKLETKGKALRAGKEECCNGKSQAGEKDCCGKKAKIASAAGKKASGGKMLASAVTCVCGSPLKEGSRVAATVHGGKILLFCSEKCRESFAKKDGACKRDKERCDKKGKAGTCPVTGAKSGSGSPNAKDCCEKK